MNVMEIPVVLMPTVQIVTVLTHACVMQDTLEMDITAVVRF